MALSLKRMWYFNSWPVIRCTISDFHSKCQWNDVGLPVGRTNTFCYSVTLSEKVHERPKCSRRLGPCCSHCAFSETVVIKSKDKSYNPKSWTNQRLKTYVSVEIGIEFYRESYQIVHIDTFFFYSWKIVITRWLNYAN